MANGYWLLVPECSHSERTEGWFLSARAASESKDGS